MIPVFDEYHSMYDAIANVINGAESNEYGVIFAGVITENLSLRAKIFIFSNFHNEALCMNRKICMTVLLFTLLVVPAHGIMIFEDTRQVPVDTRLPTYENPSEFDLGDGYIHMSLKGVFRQIDDKGKPSDYIAFVFVATPLKDIDIKIEQSELFNGKGKRFRDKGKPRIGDENVWEREIIAGIPMKIYVRFKVPVAESEILPVVARVNIRFNGEWYQFRNIRTEEWSIWEEIRKELDL